MAAIMSPSDKKPEEMNVDPASKANSEENVTTETRANEVERVLKCEAKDWHSILGVEPDCKPLLARRAALKILLLIKDRFENDTEEMKLKAHKATICKVPLNSSAI